MMSLVLAAALIAPIHGHNQAEYDDWLLNWEIQYHADSPFAHEMLQEKYDFLGRHPNGPTVEVHVDPPKRSGSSGGSGGSGGGESRSAEGWRDLVSAYFPASEVDFALKVLWCESRGDPGANNPTSSAAGLFQFLKYTWDSMVPASVTGGSYNSGQVYDPEANVRSAAWLLNAEGWSQWSCAGKVN